MGYPAGHCGNGRAFCHEGRGMLLLFPWLGGGESSLHTGYTDEDKTFVHLEADEYDCRMRKKGLNGRPGRKRKVRRTRRNRISNILRRERVGISAYRRPAISGCCRCFTRCPSIWCGSGRHIWNCRAIQKSCWRARKILTWFGTTRFWSWSWIAMPRPFGSF